MGIRTVWPVLALVFMLPATAGAQFIYRYVDAQGRVVYTDDSAKAGPNARRIEPLPPRPATRPDQNRASASTGGYSRGDALDAAVSDIATYDRELRAAEARRDRGVAPIDDERVGRLLRPEYWERQQLLQRDVENARARLDDAYARRNALK